MKTLNEIIADNLTALRKANGFTQLELAEKLNYSDKSISKWEHGEAIPAVEVLMEMSRLFDVSLDYLVSEHTEQDEKITHAARTTLNNKIIISLLSMLCVWVLAIVVYLYVHTLYGLNLWICYVWAVPASAVVGLVFNCIWGKRKAGFVLMSILVWTALASIYLQFLSVNIWPIFFLGVPLQIAIILWSNIQINK